MSKQTPTFYLFHGEDDLSIDESVAKMRQDMGANGDLNTSEYDGEQVSVPEILNAVSSYPFLSDKRLVIVKGLIGWITRKGAGETGKQAVEWLLRDLPQLPDFARLVLVERGKLEEKDKFLQLARSAPNGYEKGFIVPNDLAPWIVKRAQSEYQVEIEPRAAAALAEVIGDDLRRADNELVKLATFIAPGTLIKDEHVAALTPYVAEANIFNMVDAITEGRGAQALHLLHRLLSDKDQDPFGIFALINRQFRLLLLAKEYLTLGGDARKLAAGIKVAPYVGDKLAKQSRAFTLAQLEQIYRMLLEYDFKMKTGQLEPKLALDLLVTGLSGK
ncbi:MAG: DNA polymerase III subunit delta [Anaerolineae bacterium]|jgi:DNA polymerase-3 subunit delta|nr:DNA polymerase III subunit delta [Anaerolineae bacterium]